MSPIVFRTSRGLPPTGRRLLALPVWAVLLTGCAVGPDFLRPPPPANAAFTREAFPAATVAAPGSTGQAQQFLAGVDVPDRWWTHFQSPELDALVQEALKANPTVAAAQAALRQAQAMVKAQRGAYLPKVQAGYTPSRQKDAGESPFTLHTAQVSVGFTPDVFGGNRRAVEALRASAEAQRFQLEATYLTLAANVVTTAVEQASVRDQIAATRAIVLANTRALEILRRQLAVGQVAGLDVALVEAALAQSEQQLPELEKQLEQSRNALAALIGRLPAEAPEHQFSIDSLKLPQELPLSLPSQLVEQRPDVRVAAAELQAASAQIGVATANMLPQFSLTASRGGAAAAFGQMFATGNPFWSIVAEMSQTLFAGGSLMYERQAAQAAFDQSAALYKEAVIAAFQDVSNTLYALKSDAEALNAAVRTERATQRALMLVQKQLAAGEVDALALTASQQAYQEAVIARVQAQAARLADTAALFQALGGGWWNQARADTVASKD